MYYKIDGFVGNVVEYLEIPARTWLNQTECKCETVADLVQNAALILLLGIPALVGIVLTKPIYWVKGEKIKQIDYDTEKKIWEKRMKFLSSLRQQELIDCLIRLKIKAESCVYDSIWQFDLCESNSPMFCTYEKEGRLTSVRDSVLNDEIKILGITTFRNKIAKKSFKKIMQKTAKDETKSSSYYSPLALKRIFFNCSDEWRTDLNLPLRSLAKQAVLKTEFMVQFDGVIKYPTRKYKEYLTNVMTNTTTLELTAEDQKALS